MPNYVVRTCGGDNTKVYRYSWITTGNPFFVAYTHHAFVRRVHEGCREATLAVSSQYGERSNVAVLVRIVVLFFHLGQHIAHHLALVVFGHLQKLGADCSKQEYLPENNRKLTLRY